MEGSSGDIDYDKVGPFMGLMVRRFVLWQLVLEKPSNYAIARRKYESPRTQRC